ncbi:nitroreductase/quinone reductase family protein [Actinoplanes sp. NPDC023801]|uniref:nitroreductase/quinone reductase family protein n=1 Tax=Actinoplanes sp. NPDC023801 TaxID=3154595 RepID=UPI0033D16A39
MAEKKPGSLWLPPRWVIRTAWAVHRAMYKVSGGRVGLQRARPDQWGTLRLAVTGRRTGRERAVIVAYLEDGPNLFTIAMNGWGEGEPAWWLNLQANPDAHVVLPGGAQRDVRARAARGDEHDRLWALWRETSATLDGFAARRTTPTTVVVLEPRPA